MEVTETLKGDSKRKAGHAYSCLLYPALRLCVVVCICVWPLPQDLPSTTTKLGQSPRNIEKMTGTEEKDSEGKWVAGGEKVKTDRKTETDARGKANLCRGRPDGDKHTERRKRWARQGKMHFLWSYLHLDEIHITMELYSKPLRNGDRIMQHRVQALGNGLVCS